MTVTLALANTVNRSPLPSPPPKGKEVVSFANTPPSFGRRIVITREQLIAFLDRGEVHTYLSQSLGDRLEKTRLGRTSPPGPFSVTSETLVVCEGAFSDSKQNMYFWRLLAPEFLSITDEQGRGCFIYLAPSPVAEPNQSLQPTAPSRRG
jgi:hypothetical protein